jgi:dethiobiotin synthetase
MLEAELVVVTRSGLGTLNHTFLTIHYAESLDLQASLIISGCSKSPCVIEQDNSERLQKMVQGRLLFKIPQMGNLDTEKCEHGEIPEIDINL